MSLDKKTENYIKNIKQSVECLSSNSSLSLISYCDDTTGAITGYVAASFNESDSSSDKVYLDANLDYTTVAPTGSPCQGVSNAEVGVSTVTVTSTTTSGSVSGNLSEYSLVNVGAASGTVSGQAFPVGAVLTAKAYLDPVTNEFKKPSGLSYDATGTTFLIQTMT